MGNIHQTAVNARLHNALLGSLVLAEILNEVIVDYVNSVPQAKQISTVTIDTAAAADYAFSIDGVNISYVASGGDADTDIAQGLLAALETNPQAYGKVFATVAGAVLTITAAWPGIPFEIALTSTAANMTLATPTASASAAAVEYGRAVTSLGYDANNAVQTNTESGALVSGVYMTAGSMTFGYTYQAGQDLTLQVIFQGASYSFDATAATDADTTLAAIAAGINALLPANSVAVVGGTPTGKLVLTAEVNGVPFAASFVSKSAVTTGVITQDDINLGASADLGYGFGIAIRENDQEGAGYPTANVGGYPANVGMRVALTGQVWVYSEEDPPAGGRVWVDTGSIDATLAGRLYASEGAGRYLLPAEIAVWQGITARNGTKAAVVNLRSNHI